MERVDADNWHSAAPLSSGKDVDENLGHAEPCCVSLNTNQAIAWSLVPPADRHADFLHPSECEPRRTLPSPKWMPFQRDQPDADAARNRYCTEHATDEWGTPTLVTAPDAGAVRIGMNWRKSFVTSASHSYKAGRTMFYEGPHEAASGRLLEINCGTTDLQFQPACVRWTRLGKVTHEYYVDSGEETDSGFLIFRENKAHQAYFDDPLINMKISAAERYLTSFPNVRFLRERGTDLMQPLRWRIAKDIYDNRRVAFSEKQRRDVRAFLEAAAGPVPLGDIWDLIGGPRSDARQITDAMLVQRYVGFRTDRVPVANTAAFLPKSPARPGRLRAFLRRFSKEQRS